MKKYLLVLVTAIVGACGSDSTFTMEDLGVTKQATTLASPPQIFNLGVTAPAGWTAAGPYSWSRVGTGSLKKGTTTKYFPDGFTGFDFITVFSNTVYNSCVLSYTGAINNMTCTDGTTTNILVMCPNPKVSVADLNADGVTGVDLNAGTGGALTDWFGPGLYAPNEAYVVAPHAVFAQPASQPGKVQVVCQYENGPMPLLKAL